MSGPLLGIVGGGQLARMTVQAASRLAVRTRVLAARPDDPAAELATETVVGNHGCVETLASFADGCDVVTLEHELVDPGHLRRLEELGHVVRPGSATLRFADKGHQRSQLSVRGFPVPRHQLVSDSRTAARLAADTGWPLVAKAVRGGYDGRGVAVVHDQAGIDQALATMGSPILVEEHVRLALEVAVVVVRRPCGVAVAYPVVETVQRDGICAELVAPARVPASLAGEATGLGLAVAEAVDAVGVLAVELFVTEQGALLVNELAPRPHNSAHHTIDGAVTSQFENHVRAVLDWPLGDPSMTAPAAAMVNVLGDAAGTDPRDRLPEALRHPASRVHLYAKQSRPGRKLGHVTAVGATHAAALATARRAAAALSGADAAAPEAP